jgi:hypothetical protein
MAINFFYHCSAYYTSLVCLPRIEGNFGWWKEDRKEKKKGRPVVKWGGDALQMGPSKLQQLLAPVQLVKSHPTSKLSLDNWFKSVSLFKISSNRVRIKYRSDGGGAVSGAAWNVRAKSSKVDEGGVRGKSSSARVKTKSSGQARLNRRVSIARISFSISSGGQRKRVLRWPEKNIRQWPKGNKQHPSPSYLLYRPPSTLNSLKKRRGNSSTVKKQTRAQQFPFISKETFDCLWI